MTSEAFMVNTDLAKSLIEEQFSEFSDLAIIEVDKQGHDNRTYRLGSDMLIRMPTKETYALKVPIEQELLPLLAPHLTVNIPVPLRMGNPSKNFPYPFSIYKWLEGRSVNFLRLDDNQLEQLALDLSKFLKELHNIDPSFGDHPGQHIVN